MLDQARHWSTLDLLVQYIKIASLNRLVRSPVGARTAARLSSEYLRDHLHSQSHAKGKEYPACTFDMRGQHRYTIVSHGDIAYAQEGIPATIRVARGIMNSWGWHFTRPEDRAKSRRITKS